MKVTFQLILKRLPMKDICKRNSRKFYSRTYSQPFYFFPPFPSIPQCLFFRPIFTPLDGPNSHLLLLTRKIVNSWREKGMFLDPRTTRKRVYLCPQLTTRYPPQYRQSSLTRESYIERYLLTLFFFFDIIPQYETILHQRIEHRVIFLRRTVTLRFSMERREKLSLATEKKRATPRDKTDYKNASNFSLPLLTRVAARHLWHRSIDRSIAPYKAPSCNTRQLTDQ